MVAAADACPAARFDGGALVTRSFDATAFNAICNDPAVAPWVTLAPGQVIDVAPLLEGNSPHVLLMAEGGGVIAICHDIGIYEIHTAFLKPDRAKLSTAGPHIRNVCLAAYYWLFTHTECWMLLTRIPAHNRAAVIFAPLVGWVKEFERKNIWPTASGEKVDLTFWSIRYDDWVRKTPGLMQSGKWFHQRLDAEMARHGVTHPRHADEDCHDLHVGAAIEMIFAGQLDKAMILYNRWAKFAGYGPISLVARNPCVIDIGDALLQCANDTFKVIKCRSAQE